MTNAVIMSGSAETLLLPDGDHEQHEPVDKGQMVYFIFILLGTGVLIPFNTFITAFDFFKEIFPTQPFEFWFSLTNNGPCFVTSLAMIPFGAYLSNSTRILSSYIAYFIIVVSVPFIGMAMNNGSITQKTAQDLVLAGVAVGGFFTGIVLPSVCGLAALFPASYIGATMSGVGVGGLIVGIIRVVTKISLPNNPDGVRTGSYIYFFIGAFLMLLCIMGYFALLRVPYGRYRMRKAAQGTAGNINAGSPEEQLISVPPTSDDDNENTDDTPPLPAMQVFKKMWLQSVMVVLTFFITLSLFPGVFGLLKSKNETLQTSGWFGIILICIFLLGDFIGRTAPRFIVLFSAGNIWTLGLFRLLFFPMYIMMAKNVITGDWIAYLTSSIFAVTNGYMCSLTMMFGPEQVGVKDKEVAGVIMTFCLNIGILSGVTFAMAINAMLDIPPS